MRDRPSRRARDWPSRQTRASHAKTCPTAKFVFFAVHRFCLYLIPWDFACVDNIDNNGRDWGERVGARTVGVGPEESRLGASEGIGAKL